MDNDFDKYNEGDIELGLGVHKDTKQYHSMVYRNHKTPSGCDRFMLWLSCDIGFDTEKECLEHFKSTIDTLKEQGYKIINEEDFKV